MHPILLKPDKVAVCYIEGRGISRSRHPLRGKEEGDGREFVDGRQRRGTSFRM